MKKKFVASKIDITVFSDNDIITTSNMGGGNIELPIDPFSFDDSLN